MSSFIDLTGKRFGKLVCIKYAPEKRKKTISKWYCKCDCGEFATIDTSNLKLGHTKSCGCLIGYRHGESGTRLYHIWASMKSRVNNKNNSSYKNYGERGIAICDEWQTSYKCFRNWAIDNGYRDDLTLERIDNDGKYEPKNCTWITKSQQSDNRRNAIRIKYKGKIYSLKEFAKSFALSHDFVRGRHKNGFSPEEIIEGRPRGKTVVEIEGVKRSFSAWCKIFKINPFTARKNMEEGLKGKEIFASRPKYRRNSRLFSINGESKSLRAWCREYDKNPSAIKYRIDVMGWDIEKALKTGPLK